MSESIFLEKIEFTENFEPFKKGTEIEFNNGMKDIIKFYLESKEDFDSKKAEDVAKRMKINVIVGENGTGKSRLFESIYKNKAIIYINGGKINKTQESIEYTSFQNYWDLDCRNIFESNKNVIEVVLDDFFIFGTGTNCSVNKIKNLYHLNFWNYQYISLFNFSVNNKNIISSFFYNKKLNFKLESKINSEFYSRFINSIDDLFKNGGKKSIESFFSGGLGIQIENFKKIYYDLIDDKKNFLNFKDNERIEFLKYFFSLFLLVGLYLWYNIEDGSKKGDKNHVHGLKVSKDINKYLELEGFKDFFIWINKLEKLLKMLKGRLLTSGKEYNLLKGLKESIKIINGIINKEEKYITIKNLGLLHPYESSYEGGGNLIDLLFTGFYKNTKFIKDGNKLIGTNRIYQTFRNISFKNQQDFEKRYTNLSKYNKTYKKTISKEEISIFGSWLFLNYFYINEEILFNNLSSGEKVILLRFTNITKTIQESKNKNFLILIDEPDLHLHLDWQKQYIQKLIDVFSSLLAQEEFKDISLHFIIATHSPFLLSDVPAENVILLKKGDYGFTEVIKWENLEGNNTKNTFGANFVDLIRTGFFFSNKNLMGSFAENIIGDIANCERKTICNEIMCNQYKLPTECEKGECLDLIKNKIGDPFLKDNLLYFKKKDAEDGDRGDS